MKVSTPAQDPFLLQFLLIFFPSQPNSGTFSTFPKPWNSYSTCKARWTNCRLNKKFSWNMFEIAAKLPLWNLCRPWIPVENNERSKSIFVCMENYLETVTYLRLLYQISYKSSISEFFEKNFKKSMNLASCIPVNSEYSTTETNQNWSWQMHENFGAMWRRTNWH